MFLNYNGLKAHNYNAKSVMYVWRKSVTKTAQGTGGEKYSAFPRLCIICMLFESRHWKVKYIYCKPWAKQWTHRESYSY